VNSKVEQIWKDAGVAYFEMLPFNVSGGTESNLGTKIAVNLNVLLDREHILEVSLYCLEYQVNECMKFYCN
jgi:hypothetical protein